MIKGAEISKDGIYRYSLSREWDKNKPKVMFLMLNPSKADSEIDDPTIRRCIGYAKDWGYGGILVGNLFAYRATDPIELLNYPFPEGGLMNRLWVRKMTMECDKIICCWGNSSIISKIMDKKGYPYNHIQKVLTCKAKDRLYYLDMCKDGLTPKHPLYLSKSLKPIKYDLYEIKEIV